MADITLREFDKLFMPNLARYKRDKFWNIKVTDQNSRTLMCDSFGDYRHARVADIEDRKVIAWWIEAHLLRVVVETTDAIIFNDENEKSIIEKMEQDGVKFTDATI